jgi:hypothetical protein
MRILEINLIIIPYHIPANTKAGASPSGIREGGIAEFSSLCHNERKSQWRVEP